MNQVITSVTPATPDGVNLPEHFNTALDTWYVTTELTNAFFSILIRKKDQKLPPMWTDDGAHPQSGPRAVLILLLFDISREETLVIWPFTITLICYIDNVRLIML